MGAMGTNQKFVLLLVVGISLLGWEIYSAVRSNQASNWTTTTGKVTESKMQRYRTRGRRGRSTHRHRMQFEYTYRAKGKKFSNDRVSFGASFISDMLNGLIRPGALKKYPVGKSVTVHFNPNNPQDAVIETQLPLSAYFVIVVALIMSGIASVQLFATDHHGSQLQFEPNAQPSGQPSPSA